MKAIALLSGGLDSILAARLILEQGIEVEGVHFTTVFYGDADYEQASGVAQKAAARLGIGLKIFEISENLIEIVKHPRHGYGANMNPCIDCHTLMFAKAGQYMWQSGASFLVTGEVLGERPMSQHKQALKTIEKESELEGLILRPLSAKLLEVTVPERQGWVDRDKLEAIQGRSRKMQMELADKFNITEYPNPAGGCLLTDPMFSGRLRDLIKHKIDFAVYDIRLLKLGRHFRLNGQAKLIVGRDEKENNELFEIAQQGALCFYPREAAGPTAISSGDLDDKNINDACRMIARYSDKKEGEPVEVSYKTLPDGAVHTASFSPMEEPEMEKLRI
ncbi:MAG: tRNA 4-thiouridine(8) synthase ThiI [Candidatus Omnitrophota bacterium]|jgi:tRNA U34 2-thiouridine synthase MnmA/TrmU